MHVPHHCPGACSLLAIPRFSLSSRIVTQAGQMVDGLAVKGDHKAAAEQIKALYRLFVDADCTMVEACAHV